MFGFIGKYAGVLLPQIFTLVNTQISTLPLLTSLLFSPIITGPHFPPIPTLFHKLASAY